MRQPILVRGALCGALVLSLGACGKIKSMVEKAEGGSASSSGLSLSGFEGEIHVTASAKTAGQPDKTFTVPLLVKGNKFRVNMPAGLEAANQLGNVYGIVDTDAKKLYAVLDKQREVVEVDLNKVGDQLKGMTPSAPTTHGAPKAPEYPPKITKTGKTDTVAGFSCENWDVQSTQPGDKSKALVCVSQQGVSWFRLPLTGAPAAIVALGELVDGQHFPLRAIVYAKDGTTEVARVEVSKVDKKTLDAQTFTPPAGYKVVTVEQAMGGLMMGGMAGPGAIGGHPAMKGLPAGLPTNKPARL